MNNFPKVRECGLTIETNPWLGSCVRAADVEALLEKATVVYGEMAHGCPTAFSTTRTPYGLEQATHTALLINVRPLEKPDTAEGLLREFVKIAEHQAKVLNRDHGGLFERAKKLLSPASER